jgi:heptose I phosphotransferase
MLKLLAPYRTLFPERGWGDFCRLEGETFKRIQNRRTFRIERAGRRFFVKCHRGVGWREIFKNLFALRLPVLGAGNEWRAIHRLRELGVETMTPVAYGREGWNPAGLHSLLVTEELANCVSLERYTEGWQHNPPPPAQRRLLIERLARIARTLHLNGVNHRDLYLCHFLIRLPWDGSAEGLHLHLIDLHRVQIRRRTPQRWIVKDLGALLFSAQHLKPSRAELLRFVRVYRGTDLRRACAERRFWNAVRRRAEALAQRRR